jgi:hypothetical protein
MKCHRCDRIKIEQCDWRLGLTGQVDGEVAMQATLEVDEGSDAFVIGSDIHVEQLRAEQVCPHPPLFHIEQEWSGDVLKSHLCLNHTQKQTQDDSEEIYHSIHHSRAYGMINGKRARV